MRYRKHAHIYIARNMSNGSIIIAFKKVERTARKGYRAWAYQISRRDKETRYLWRKQKIYGMKSCPPPANLQGNTVARGINLRLRGSSRYGVGIKRCLSIEGEFAIGSLEAY